MERNIRASKEINSVKRQLRERILERRKLLTRDEIGACSSQICKALFQQEYYKKATSVLIYISFDKEVDTEKLIKQMKLDHKKIYAPRIIDFDKGEMDFFQITDKTRFDISNKNIMEPMQSESFYKQTEHTLCITPGIAFDQNKNRIGYGKGFYDRFFERISCDKIAICYDFQIVDHVPSAVNDKKMDMIISERRII